MDANKIINKLGMTSVMLVLSVYGLLGYELAVTSIAVMVVTKTIIQFILWGAHGGSISKWDEYKINFTPSDWIKYIDSMKVIVFPETPFKLKFLINITWFIATIVLYKSSMVGISIAYLVSTVMIQTMMYTLRRLVREEIGG